MKTVPVWDLMVRLFHWVLAGSFLANSFLIDDDWALHRWIGYAVLGLVVFRILWGFVGTRHARFSAFPPSLSAAARHLRDIAMGRPENHISHNPLGALMVYLMLASLALVSVTGMMAEGIGFPRTEWAEGPHELLANWTLVLAGLHIGGVLFEQYRSDVNLVRAMITGRKEIQDDES